MRLKCFTLSAIVCMFGIFTSCTDSDSVLEQNQSSKITLTEDEYISIAFDSPKEISEGEALNLVEGFSSSQVTRSMDSGIPNVIKKLYVTATLSSGKNSFPISVPVYEVNLNNKEGGYALVSGDERVPSVIAYVESGSIRDTVENVGAAMMIKEAKKALLKNIAYCELIKDSLREPTLQKIASELGVNKKIDYDGIKDQIAVGDAGTRSQGVNTPTQGTLLKEVKVLIATKWNQNSPYNNLMATAVNSSLGSSYNGKNAVGCTAVAVAQIIAYYECLSSANGVTLNWANIKSSPRIFNSSDAAVKNQVANLFKHVATGIKTSWTNGIGGANIKNSTSYLSGLGITLDAGKNYGGYSMDATRITSSLDDLCPVIITGRAQDETRSTGGGGHCWLLDGYQLRRRPTNTRMVVRENDVYIHANFGWGGSEDGYYMVDRNTTSLDFETSYNGHYNQNLKIFPNVRRK